MNPNRPGWLQHYIDFRTELPFPQRLPSSGVRMVEGTGMHHEIEEAIYYFLQPTGLLYGFPVQAPFTHEVYTPLGLPETTLPVSLIFAESLFACLVTDRHFLLENLADEEDHFPFALRTAQIFFTRGAPTRGASMWGGLGRLLPGGHASHDEWGRFETELSARFEQGHEQFKRRGAYFNSFLFLDLYDCVLWQREVLVNPDAAESSMEKLATRQIVHRHLLIRLMIAAANAGGKAGRQERRLISWFLKSSHLPREFQADLKKDLKRGLTLGEIDIPDLPWLVRRFMLEAVMMTVLIDRDYTDAEDRYLHQVVERLELWEGELNQSLMALEVFLIHQEDRLDVLKDRAFFINAGQSLAGHASAVLSKNLERIVTEIKETQELYTLMLKSTHAQLSAEEKEKVRHQLLDIMKTIPALAIFALPGGAIILPILIKLLPFNLLPSSFED